jgi:hypothetical protein
MIKAEQLCWQSWQGFMWKGFSDGGGIDVTELTSPHHTSFFSFSEFSSASTTNFFNFSSSHSSSLPPYGVGERFLWWSC